MRGSRRRQFAFGVLTVFAAAASALASNYYVDPNGASGTFQTVQAAVDAVSGQTELNRANIFVAPGVYHELVTVTKPYLSLIGTGDSPAAVKITFRRAQMTDPSFDWGEVFGVESAAIAFMARNVTFENSTPDGSRGPALAVRSSADRAIFDSARFLGYQDTLLADNASRQYFRSSFVTGDGDFIFGDATAVFDQCTIQSTDHGWVTAANTQRTTANGLIFLDCKLVAGSDAKQTGGDASSPDDGSVYLGRPWQWYRDGIMPSVTFIRTRMGRHITKAGWDPWNETGVAGVDPSRNRDPLTRVSEFGSMDLAGNPLPDSNGDGRPDGRVAWEDVMTAEKAANYTLDHIFGPANFWNSSTQPEASGVEYQEQGAPWDANGQLALLPSQGGAASHALNISTRVRVGTGDNVMIAGFIVRGASGKQVMLRALGASLRNAGIADVLADPVLELHSADGTLLDSNDNWRSAQEAEITASGIAPTEDSESAIISSVAATRYTAVVRNNQPATGIGLAEIYDLAQSADSELVNLSTRGFAGAGEELMIAGFILAGGGPAKVVVRGIGPSLGQAGIAQPLADPSLTLRNADGAAVAFNNNWKDAQQTEIQATGLAPVDDRDSAIVATLPAGAYTAVLAGNAGETGVALVEVYNLE